MTKSRILFLLLLIAVAMLIPLTSYDISIQVRDSEKQATPQAYPFGIQLKPVIPEAHALDIINDDFASGLNGWTYGAIPGYSQCGGYTLTRDTGTGSPAPSGRVSGNSYSCYAAMKKTVSLSGWTYPTPLYLSFSWRAYSGYYYSTVTNMALYIYDGSTYLYGYTLISGGAYDTGWRNWNPTNIASNVAGHSSITIYFQLVDAWSYNWNQQIWADNVRLSYTPPTASITITSNPLGPGYVAVDGSPISTPQTYPWTVGSAHTLAATSPVSCGSGCQYAWSSWSDGGAQTHAITVPSIIVIDDFASTAGWYFNRISASASGGILTGTITGGDPYMWKDIQDFSGSSYPYVIIRMSVNSPGTSSAQIFWVNEQGGWSETRSQHFNVINDGAFYVYTIDLRSNANWNGRTIQWFRLDPSDQGSSGTFQVDYIYAASAPTTYTASFKRQYQLTMAVNPAGAGTTNPAVGSYWYDSGQSVPISASAASGYVFQSWSGGGSGSYSGSSNPATVTMNGPISETANFQLNTVTITFQLNGIGSDVTGIIITIDGTGYTYIQLPRSFIWSVGSTHTVAAADPVAAGTGKQYDWTSWTNGDGLSGPSGAYTTPSSSQTVTANYVTQYQLTVNSAYDSPNPTSGWFNAGTSITASVSSPVSGPSGARYVCTGWTGAGSVPASGTGTSVTFTMNAPSSITWNWKTQYQLTVAVSPSGSGTTTPAVGSYWYDSGSQVTISATAASGYRFQSWIGSGAGSYTGSSSSAQITMNGPITETATFIKVVTITFQTGGMSEDASGTVITIDGVDYTFSQLPKSFTWDADSTHTIAASSPVNCGSGCQYVWASWSDGGAQSHTYTTPTSAQTVTATYTKQYQVTFAVNGISSDATGTVVTVNGAAKTLSQLPYTAWYDSGATVTYSFASPVSASSGKQYAWLSTSGLGQTAQSGTFTASASGTVTATYRTQFELTIQVDPPGTGNTNPAAGTYWYNAGEAVQLSAGGSGGYVFTSWTGTGTGSYTGTDNPATITMNAPITETANFAQLATMSVSYGILDGGSPTPPTFNYVLGGVSKTYTLTETPTPIPTDPSSAWSVTPNPLGGSSLTERWYSNQTLSGTASSTTLVFKFQHEYKFTIQVNNPRYGTTAPIPGDYWQRPQQSIQVTATPAGNCRFDHWELDGQNAGTSTQYTVTMDAPHTLQAVFKTNSHQVTITAIGTGPDAVSTIVTVDGVTYDPTRLPLTLYWEDGSTHTVEAAQTVSTSVSGKCYNWDRWVGGGSARVLQITANSTLTLTASFKTQYLLSAYSIPTGAETMKNPDSTTGFYDPGTTVQLTASNDYGGLAFVRWLLNGEPQPQGQTSLTVTMSEPSVAIAMYEMKQQQSVTVPAYDALFTSLASLVILAVVLVATRRRT